MKKQQYKKMLQALKLLGFTKDEVDACLQHQWAALTVSSPEKLHGCAVLLPRCDVQTLQMTLAPDFHLLAHTDTLVNILKTRGRAGFITTFELSGGVVDAAALVRFLSVCNTRSDLNFTIRTGTGYTLSCKDQTLSCTYTDAVTPDDQALFNKSVETTQALLNILREPAPKVIKTLVEPAAAQTQVPAPIPPPLSRSAPKVQNS